MTQLDLINSSGVIVMKNPTLIEKPRLSLKERFENKGIIPRGLVLCAKSVNEFFVKLVAALKSLMG
ncbi:MAG: hypothetical protein H7Z70_07525 [Bacteroidia bacterium]|nr:hypothetical protein [Methylotenera sp.]